MANLIGSAEFWFGALLLCTFQIGKFAEINQLDPDLKGQPAVPNLRASDFLGRTSYRGTLAAFLLFTLTCYVLLCLASPSLIGGWARITGKTTEAAEIEKLVQSAAYPLWIAAAFMGLAHQVIPGFSNVPNIQRDAFHDLAGIPRRVVDASAAFSTQMLLKAPSKEKLAEALRELCSVQWRARIESFADITFFPE